MSQIPHIVAKAAVPFAIISNPGGIMLSCLADEVAPLAVGCWIIGTLAILSHELLALCWENASDPVSGRPPGSEGSVPERRNEPSPTPVPVVATRRRQRLKVLLWLASAGALFGHAALAHHLLR